MRHLFSLLICATALFGSTRALAEPSLDSPLLLDVQGRASAAFSDLGTVQLSALDSVPETVPLSLEPGAKLSGLCADLTPFTMVGPTRGLPTCNAGTPKAPLAPLAPLRGGASPLVPRVLSPRTGYVRELGWIEWRRVADSNAYTVELLDDRFAPLWSQSVAQRTMVLYPSSAPRLEPARFYTIRVSSAGESSQAEHADLAFQLLPAALRAVVEKAECQLTAAKLTETQRGLLRGLVLRHFQLRAEAMAAFAAGTGAAFDLERAETLRQVGLLEAAASAWRRVLATTARGTLQRARASALLNQLGLPESER